MNSIDTTSNGLYFNAAQAAQTQLATDQTRRKEKEKDVKKSIFSSLIKNNAQENILAAQGLPEEIAGMEEEEAFIFLKDRMDLAGNNLVNYGGGANNLEDYKKAVSQFIKFIQKTNYKLEEHKLPPRKPWQKPRKNGDSMVLVQTINQKLDQLTQDIWYNNLDKLRLLERVNEITGLVIDLTVA